MEITEASAPPAYNNIMGRSQLINNVMNKYEIDLLFSEKLSILENYEIVLLLDESGSMNTPLSEGPNKTRWEELKSVVKIILDIAMIFDTNGIDIFFLNRDPIYNATSFKMIDCILPYGRTPLTEKYNFIFERYQSSEKPVLFVIATDGVPTNSNGYEGYKRFERCMMNKNHNKFFVSFLACSDQDDDVSYLNKLDKKVPNIDTLDDYLSEKEVQNVQGKSFKYSLGDHIARLLLGPLCPELDNLDERKVGTKRKRQNCIIL